MSGLDLCACCTDGTRMRADYCAPETASTTKLQVSSIGLTMCAAKELRSVELSRKTVLRRIPGPWALAAALAAHMSL